MEGRDAMHASAGDMMGSVSGPFTGEEEGKDTSQNPSAQMERTASERKRIGKIHATDSSLNDVVATEMARIRQAFDRRVVEHTEEMVTKV